MAATATRPRRTTTRAATPEREQLTRDQAAERLKPLLTMDPQSEAALGRQLGTMIGNARAGITVVHDALAVLEARREAKRVPYRSKPGWTRYDSAHEEILAHPQEVQYPPFELIRLDQMFVPEYQRPLTNFVQRIQRRFVIDLVGTLSVSDRGARHKPARFALMDGQTRWAAMKGLGIAVAPCIVRRGLTVQQEARIFAQLQKERKNVTSWWRFRADLFAEEPEALAIRELVEACGLKLGEGTGQMKAVAALENTYRSDPHLLTRSLIVIREAWPNAVPEGPMIKGLHYFFRNYPVDDPKTRAEVKDDRLVRRLATAGPRKVESKAASARDYQEGAGGAKGNAAKWLAFGIQAIYKGGV